MAAGAGARTRDMPARITDYVPSDSDVGGFFDDHKRAKQAYEKGKSAAAAKAAAAAPAAAAGSSSTAAGPSLSTSSGAAKSS